MAMDDSSKPLGTWKILWEALKIPTKNWRLMLSIIFLSLLSSTLLFFGNDLSFTPLITNLVLKKFSLHNMDHTGPEFSELLVGVKKDIREFTAVEVAFLISFPLISFLIDVIKLIAIVYATAMTYTGKHLTLEGLFFSIRRAWKEPLITRLYVFIINLGYILLFMVLMVAPVLTSNTSLALIASGFVLAFSTLPLYAYVSAVWSLSLVVSTIEEGCYGMAAYGRARELIRGKKRQGFTISLTLVAVYSAIYGAYYLSKAYDARMVASDLGVGFVKESLFVLLNMLTMAVGTVFYYECKKSHEKTR